MTRKTLRDLYLDYHTLLQDVAVDDRDINNSILEGYKRTLSSLSSIDGNQYQLFDFTKRTHVYISPNYHSVFNLEPETSMDIVTHPEDLYRMTELGIEYIKFAQRLPLDTKKHYKLTNDFRMKTKTNDWVRVTKSYICLELDTLGNFWLCLNTLNFSPDTNTGSPLKSRIVNILTGQTLFFPNLHSTEATVSPLTERELQILDLLGQGYSSKIVAHILGMSLHTVNTHRQNMLKKTQLKNSAELIKYATETGLLLKA